MKIIHKTARYFVFPTLLLAAGALFAEDADVSFSCMKQQVRPIILVTDRYQEFDVVVRNWCPGAVYWAMCIERLDPWTFEILENHVPTGYVDVDKRNRVNLQMKAVPEADGDVKKAQAFYVNVAFSIEGPTTAECVARGCESRKKELRAEQARNNRAWKKARKALDARAAKQCPDNGWNTEETRNCRQAVINDAAEEMLVFEETDEALRERMEALSPGNCAVHGGNVIELVRS